MTTINHIADYQEKRLREYPDLRIYLDSKVKQSSPDPVIQSEGVLQEADYHNDCFAIKLKYPKPQGDK